MRMSFKQGVLPLAGGLLFFTVLIGASQALVGLNVALSPAVPWFPLPAFVLAGVATWWANRRWPMRLTQSASGRAYAVALLLTYAVICLGVLESWLHDLTTPAPTWPDETLSAGFQLLYLITLPIIAAVLAEVSFRGLIQTALEKVMPLWPMLAMIAVLNFLMHFYDPHQFSQVFRLLALNLVWGWVTWRTQSIRPALAGHVAMNIGIAALQYGSENYGPGPVSYGDFPPSTLIISAVSGIVALVLGLLLGKGLGRH
jgi:membrane protease YdiL (CAAX protease family)